MHISRRSVLQSAAFAVLTVSCGGSTASDTSRSTDGAADAEELEPSVIASNIRLVPAEEGGAMQSAPPDDLVILDVRTIEEFTEARIDGATMIDFYRDDFAEQIAQLDPDVPYLVYCHSGSRSGQTASIMRDLGFADVADVDGGIVAWQDAGLPTIAG